MSGQTITSKIALGTVQFGLPYGISNTGGQTPLAEAKAILTLARSANIQTLDTAIAYGNSEATLGALDVCGWQVITKLPEMPVTGEAAVKDWVKTQLDGSLNRLGLASVHGLLLHRPAQLNGPDGTTLYRALLEEREKGRVAKIGISIYGPDELDQLPTSMGLDIVQAPFNILDQRMATSGWIARLQEAGCELHVRSIFLQGLLLMQAAARPAYFSRWNALWENWESWLREAGLTPLQACLRHALNTPGIAKVVLGVDNAAHLADILTAADGALPLPPPGLAIEDIQLLNPALWNRS